MGHDRKKIVTIQQRFIKMAKSPFCSFRTFFRELLGFLLNWRKQRPKGLKPFASFSAKSLRISHPEKSECHFTKGSFYG
jgi:hypothetical protein